MFEPLPAKFDFHLAEERVLKFWREHDIFARSLEQRRGAERFVFYEGPPTANGLPHPGHCLTRAMKDLFPRYQTMCGKLVERKAGWDTHGLPVEVEVCKELGIHSKDEIETYGVEKFVRKCVESVWRYTREWESMTTRLGFWINLDEAYATYHQYYVESVWWSLKTLFDRGLLYQGHKVVWWWAQGGTALSAGEVGEGYREVDDPSVYVRFPLVEGQKLPGVEAQELPGVAGQELPGAEGGAGFPQGGAGFQPAVPAGGADFQPAVPAGGAGFQPAVPAGGAGFQPAVPQHGPEGISRDLKIRQRRLPHWQAGGSTYFVTFRTAGAQRTADGVVESTQLAEQEREIALQACLHFDAERMLVHAAVVMPDHVHLLITPLEKSSGVWWPLSELLHSIKSFSANRIGERRRHQSREKQVSVWQDEYFDRIIRTEEDFDEKRNYILNNPVKRGLPETYTWLWEEASADRKVLGQATPEAGESVASGESATSGESAASGGSVASGGQDAHATLGAGSASHRTAQASGRVGQASSLPVSLLVWTTTPWTLISNHFAAVNPKLDYALVYDKETDEHLYIAAALVEKIAKKIKRELEVVATCKGTDLVGLRYVPPFRECYYDRKPTDSCFQGLTEDEDGLGRWVWPVSAKTLGEITARVRGSNEERHIGWRMLPANFVTTESGTGVVHEAPAFGEVDFDLLRDERAEFEPGSLGESPVPLICAVRPDGKFRDQVVTNKWGGEWVKDCDKDIIRDLKDRGLLYHQETYRHDYPFCPRAEDDPLIQYARKSWFVRTSQFKDEFLKNNDAIKWLPEHIKDGRFGDFLRNNVDWAISRERFWGTPLPIWVCEQTGKMEALGSFAELTAKPGATDASPEYPQGFWATKKAEHPEMPDDLRVHKPYIDEWTYDSPFVAEATKGEGEAGSPQGGAGSPQGGAGFQPAGGQDAHPTHRMRRVTEVIDCWWDAGSMPFAQWGFPHVDGSRQKFADRFPANFISEAIDQTRGWFYGLLAISTMLFQNRNADSGPDNREGNMGSGDYPMPYKACIVLGHMMGEDGLKMSKRLKNYKEPSYVFDQFGADAMRWYFFSAQAPWTTARFEEANIRDAQREFLVRLYNVFSFFNIYANIDGFEAGASDGATERRSDEGGGRGSCRATGWRAVPQRSELDRWVISELHRTILTVRESMDGFQNYPAAGRLNDFVDALSNWYVRRSRDRFWRSEKDQDKWDAYNTLYEVLAALSKLIAPFTPFFAETMYQNLTGIEGTRDRGSEDSRIQGAKEASGSADSRQPPARALEPSNPQTLESSPLSVHLCDYPQPDHTLINQQLAEEMDIVRELVSLGRSARTASKIKVRQPLPLVEIILARHEHDQWLTSHAALIAEELNVKQVQFSTEADHYVSYQVKPNFKAIGPRFGKLAPKIAKALAALPDPAAARKTLNDSGKLTISVDSQDIELTADDVEIRLEAKEGWSAAQGRSGVVVLKTEITPELRDECLVREVIHVVQGLRKEHDLAYESRITLYVSGPEEFVSVVRRFEPTIKTECLAEQIVFDPAAGAEQPAGVELRDFKIEGHDVKIGLADRT